MEVRTLANRQPIQRYIAQGCLRWLGHLLWSPLNHPALANYTFNPKAAGWSRTRGAPRTRWSDVLGKDLKQLGTTFTEASNIALDRSRWRSTIVARAVSTPSWQESVKCVMCLKYFITSRITRLRPGLNGTHILF